MQLRVMWLYLAWLYLAMTSSVLYLDTAVWHQCYDKRCGYI